MKYRVVLPKLPTTLAEMMTLPQAALRTPQDTAALTVAALCAYPRNPAGALEMLDYLRGPRPMSPSEKQFLKERFSNGWDYLPRSYLMGAVPQNNYTPSYPYTVELSDSFSQIAEPGYHKFDVRSGGADNPRPVTLRSKPSTGQWFLWDQILMVQIRVPVSQDPWA